MSNNKIEVFRYYKSQDPKSIFLFLVNDHYEAYGSDSEPISKTLGMQIIDGIVSLPTDNILDVVGRLSSVETPVRLIRSRDENGSKDLPDINIILAEQSEDY